LPYYNWYVPDQEIKKEIAYDFWARSAIFFRNQCEAGSISDVIPILENLDDVGNGTLGLNIPTFVAAIIAAVV